MKPTVLPGADVRAELVEARAGRRARAHDGHADRGALDRLEQRREIGVEIDLVEHDDGLRAAVPDRRHVALEAALVEVAVRGRDDEEHVDVHRDDLRLALRAGRAPHERGTPIAHVLNRRAVGAVDNRDPVADDGTRDLVARLHQSPAQDRRAARGNPRRGSCSALPRRCARAPSPASSCANWLAKKSSKPREASVVKPCSRWVVQPLSIRRVLCRADRASVVPQYAPSSRGVAQPGRALRSGRRGRRFKSYHPDQQKLVITIGNIAPPVYRSASP